MLTKSATPNASRRPAAERSEGAVPCWLADEVSNSNASRRPAAERSEGAVPIRLADERREQVHARKGKSKIWRVRSNIQQAQVHARKEKARFGVCGATPNRRRYTPERKKQDLACAEQHPTSSRNYLLYKQAEA